MDAGVGIGMVAPYGAPDEHHDGGNGNPPMRDRRRGQRYGGAKNKAAARRFNFKRQNMN